MQLADVCATTMFLTYEVNGFGFSAPCFSTAMSNHLYRYRGSLENYGIKIDEQKNEWSFTGNAETCISADDSATKIFVIPTDEELVMTEDAYALMKGTYDVHTNFTYSFQSPDYVNKAREEGLKGDLVKRPNIAKVIARPPKK